MWLPRSSIDVEGAPTNWTELREFRAVDLTESFIVGWGTDRDSLMVDLDLFLCPEHAFYEAPRPAEGACYRPAMLEFPHCVTLSGDKVGTRPRSVSHAAAQLAHGRISGLRVVDDGRYEMTGAFGKVEIHAERPILRLKREHR